MKQKIIITITFIILFVIIFLIMTTKQNNVNLKEEGLIEVYHRGVDFIGHDGIPEGPRLHPFLKDWGGNYHELINENGIIIIGSGDLKNISKATRYYLKENKNVKPDDKLLVDKNKFQEAIKNFKKEHEGREYSMFDFKENCIAFKDYVIEKSKVK